MLISLGANTKATGGLGSDYFAYGARAGSSVSDGNLQILDFKATEDKLDLSQFKNSTNQAISLADILANSETATVDSQQGVKISFTNWKLNDAAAGTGFIFIKGASITTEATVKLSIEDQNNVSLTSTILDLTSSTVNLSTFNFGDVI